MFHILEREMQWRREQGRPEGFGALRASPPIVAVGAEDPLEDQKMLADYFRKFLRIIRSLKLLTKDLTPHRWNRWPGRNPCQRMLACHYCASTKLTG
jgi:hypothetical protein